MVECFVVLPMGRKTKVQKKAKNAFATSRPAIEVVKVL